MKLRLLLESATKKLNERDLNQKEQLSTSPNTAQPNGGKDVVTQAPALPLASSTGPQNSLKPGAEKPGPAKTISPAHWFVNLGTFPSELEAGKVKKAALAIHPRLDIVPVEVDQSTLFRVRTEGMESKQKAETIAKQLQTALQLSGVWVAQAHE